MKNWDMENFTGVVVAKLTLGFWHLFYVSYRYFVKIIFFCKVLLRCPDELCISDEAPGMLQAICPLSIISLMTGNKS